MDSRDRFILAAIGLAAVASLAHLASPLVPSADLHPLRTKVLELFIGAVSAVGTLGAVVVALWLGLDGQRRLDRADGYRATLAAAKIGHLVQALADQVSLTRARLTFGDSFDGDVTALQGFAAEAGPLLATFTDDDLLALMPLPNHVGGRLASGIARLRILSANFQNRSFYEAVTTDEVNSAIRTVDQVSDSLEVVARKLAELASGAAPEPSIVELHGEPVDRDD